MKAGVYIIRCTVNEKLYIGSSDNIRRRWMEHRSRLRKGNHANTHLQNAWNKYGEIAFIFDVLEEVCDIAHLIEVEQKYLNCFRGDWLYNVRMDAADSNLGTKMPPCSEATRLKRSVASKGNQYRKGIPHSISTKQAMSVKRKGIPKSEEHKRKIAAAHMGKPSPMKGVARSEETKRKISATKRFVSSLAKSR
jgi:group I intron endonuclease